MIWQDLSHSFLGFVFFTILGLMVGSFLNVVIYRLPIMMENAEKAYANALLEKAGLTNSEDTRFNLCYPPSACPNCKCRIRFWQNIPVVSYLLQHGKCTNCQASISVRYLLVELLTAMLSLLVAIHFHELWQIGFALLFTWALVALVFIDAEHQLLPDVITLPLMWLGILAGVLGVFVPLEVAVVGAMVGYLSLWSVYWLFKLITGREGMGYGDFKLLAALCAFQGAQAIPMILLFAAVCGLIYAAIVRIGKGKPFAFGPFLALAGWISFMYGNELNAISGLFGIY